MRPFKFCPECGRSCSTQEWPFQCPCGHKVYQPFQMGVALILWMASGQLVVIERGTDPIGGWAFPGGYLEPGETWQEGMVRELREETLIVIEPARVRLVAVEHPRPDFSFIFGAVQICPSELEAFQPTNEARDIRRLWPAHALKPEMLCFSSHTRAVEKFLKRAA